MSSVNGICKLCQNPSELRGSHILSELLYKETYDKIHRATEMRAQSGRHRFIQKGYREPMLCDDCESRISRYETYFADEWINKGKMPKRIGSLVTEINGLDYTKFKLFHLSILWRAGVSTREEFRNVKLGPHEETIRKMLLNDAPGTREVYPLWGRILFDPADGRVADDLVMEPEASRHGAHYIYVFTFSGCAWYHIVSSHDPSPLVPTWFEPNSPLVLVAESIYSYPPLVDFIQSYQEAKNV